MCMASCPRVIKANTNAKKWVVVVYLYMAMAFDRVPHRWLMKKIKSYGVIDHIISCFTPHQSSSYRVEQVDVCTSQPKQVTST